MRKLMWFAIGFAAACGLCVYVLPEQLRTVCIWVCAAVMLFFAGVGRKWKSFLPAALILLGALAGQVWYGLYHTAYLSAAAAVDGESRTLSIRTVDYSEDTAYGIAADGILTLKGKTYQVRVYLDETEHLEPGKILSGPFRLRFTVSEKASSHSAEGTFLLAYQNGEVSVQKAEDDSWQDQIARFRQRIREILHVCFPEDTVPFAQALLLGDTSELDYETDTDFKVSGIRHVVAVSGLHVSILFALLGAVTFRKKYLMAPLGFGLLALFAALSVFTPSVTRACIMSGLLLLALLLNREYDGPTALSFAVLVMLICNPLVIASVSFQLSVASVAGIYLFCIRIYDWLKSKFKDPVGRNLRQTMLHWLVTSVSITLSATVLTAPLCAYYFGMVSLIGVVTNLLVLWLISIIFYGIMAVCLLYGCWAAGAVWTAKMISWPIRYVLVTAKILADFPLAAVYTESVYITAWLVFVYVLLAVLLISRQKRPLMLACCAVFGLCLALMISWAEPAGDAMRVTVLDVGQGQCILLQSGSNTVMVDCGGDRDESAADIAAEALLSQGIQTLDCLILTHLDRDHAGGAEKLLTRIEPRLLILPAQHTLLGQDTDAEVVYASENLRLSFDGAGLSVYVPSFPGSGNEKSLCVLFDTEKCDILITGDRSGFGERMLLRNADIPDVDVLIAGHHGSKNSTCEELLTAVRPEIVCISAGRDNSFGHPAPELLARLAKYGCTVYRTDLDGSITIRR